MFAALDLHAGSSTSATALSLGAPTTGHLLPRDDQDWFAVTLTAGQTYRAVLTTGDPEVELRVYTPGLSSVGTGQDFSFTATTSGTHYIRLSAGFFDHPPGDYALRVEVTP